MMKHRKILFSLVVLSAQLLDAQSQTDSLMSLHDCMSYALCNSTQMRIEAADRNDEQWQRRQAVFATFTPYVEAQAYAYNQYGRNLDPETNTYNNVKTFYNGYSISAGITLFDGFKAVNNVRMASTLSKMGLSREQQTRDEICLAVMEAYFNVVYYSKLESVLTDEVANAESALSRTSRQFDLGQKSRADVLQMESELAQRQYQLISATNHKSDALITLKDVMFYPSASSFDVDTTLAESVMPDVNVADVQSTAKASLPSAMIAAADYEKAEADLKMARGSYSPKLSLYAGWSTTYYTYPGMAGYTPVDFRDQFKNNAGEYIQLSLSIPIFDQLQRRSTLHAKKNAVVRSQAEYEKTIRNIENEVLRAANDRDGALAAFFQADRLASLQHEAYRLNSRQFAEGLISAIELQTASQTYLNAMAERINALLQLKLKDSILRYYNGEHYINQ